MHKRESVKNSGLQRLFQRLSTAWWDSKIYSRFLLQLPGLQLITSDSAGPLTVQGALRSNLGTGTRNSSPVGRTNV